MSVNAKSFAIVLGIVVIAGLSYVVLTTPEHRTVGEKIGDAVDHLDNGVDDAARQLKDRSPAEKIKDEVKDATDSK